MGRPKKVKTDSIAQTDSITQVAESAVAAVNPVTTQAQDLVNALVQAIQLTKPKEKKTPINRTPGSPWDPKDGSKKPKLKRKHYQHGLIMDPSFLSVEEIELLNKLKPGRFFDGLVKVYKRRDSGIDIDYPVKTASQRMRVASYFTGGLAGFLRRCLDEAASPTKYVNPDDEADE